MDETMHGEKLAAALRATGLSTRQVAAACGVSIYTSWAWMSGQLKFGPHPRNRAAIEALLERASEGRVDRERLELLAREIRRGAAREVVETLVA